ncbi:hypothetical protein L218DRAFT_948823 [Marasmius fiardii PR-910]|nr:hypothetical protein L218DRAFT_948823 [Marasmius fiardii PR-910]
MAEESVLRVMLNYESRLEDFTTIARRTDLDRYSTTDIPLQRIVIENNEFYSPEFPLIRLSTFDLTPNDWRSVRDQYAEPFGLDDHIRGQARGFTRSSTQGGNVRIQPPGPSGSPGDDPDSNDPRRSRPHKDKGKGHNNSGRENSQPLGSGGGGPPGGPPGPPDGNGPPDSGSDFDIDRTNSDDESEDSISHPSQFKRSETPRSRLQPAIFGQTRFSSSPGDTFNEKERFVYNPTPLSDVEILRAAFRCFEDLINYQLIGRPYHDSTAANLRKTLLQSIPKPEFYYGDIGTLLKGDAGVWFNDYVEAVPDNFDQFDTMKGRKSFMEVISGLYRRFIHDASLTHVAEKMEDVRYTASGGIKGVFSAMIRFAKCMPSPPDPYTFKKKLFLKVPDSMASDMTDIHGVTAESSTVDEIMQAALAVEHRFTSRKYFQKLKEENKCAKRRRSRSRSRDRKRNPDKGKQKGKERSLSPRQLQKVDGHRYQVKPYSKQDNGRPDWYNKKYSKQNAGKTSNGKSHSTNNRPSERKTDQPNTLGRLYHMVETKQKDGVRLYHMVEADASENEAPSSKGEASENEMLAAINSGSELEQSEAESDPWGGSQYSSDADERVGFMRDDESSNNEHFAAMRECFENDDSENEELTGSEIDLPSDETKFL